MTAETAGLRARKKALTRQQIAAAAARLFGERAYENVTVADVAREADVSPQTVYNYFPAKADLVTDREEVVQRRLTDLIHERPPGLSPVAAIRPSVLASVAAIRDIPADQWRGEIGQLALISPEVHRLSLEMTDRQGAAIAAAILDTSDVTPAAARLQGMALAGLYQILFAEGAQRSRDGEDQARIADELTVIMEQALDELERWCRR